MMGIGLTYRALGAAGLLLLLPLTLEAQRPRSPEPAPAPWPSPFHADRGWLGISYDGGTAGWVVLEVAEESPAEEAGIEPGDTIVAVDGVRTTGQRSVRISLELEPGDTVRLGVRRDGRLRDVDVVAGRRAPHGVWSLVPHGATIPHDSVFGRMRVFLDSAGIQMDSTFFDRMGRAPKAYRVPSPPHGAGGTPRAPHPPRVFIDRISFVGSRAVAGAELTEVTPGLASYFDGVTEGVLVTRVAEDTPAEKAGLREGDVIVEAGGRSVDDVDDLRRAVRADRDQTLKVVRKGRTLELKLPE